MTIPLCAWSSSGYGTSVAPLSGLRDVEPLGELYIVDGSQTPRIADRPAAIGSENYISVSSVTSLSAKPRP